MNERDRQGLDRRTLLVLTAAVLSTDGDPAPVERASDLIDEVDTFLAKEREAKEAADADPSQPQGLES